MQEHLSVLPLDLMGLVALICVSSSMIALGIGAEPARVLAQGVPVRPLAAALVIALGVVPALSLVVCRSYDLRSAELVGLVLMGISPGAPMALRKSRQSGGDGDFSLVLQIAVAVLAIATVPVWIVIIRLLYGHPAGLSVLVLAKQIFLAQLLPLTLGFLVNLLLPTLAKRLIRPLLWLSGLLMLAIVILLIATFWRQLASLSILVVAASATLTMGALLLAHLFCGPSPAIRVSSGIICSLRNPGIALLIASANGLPSDARVTVIAHVLITAMLIAAYLAFLGRTRTLDPGTEAGTTQA